MSCSSSSAGWVIFLPPLDVTTIFKKIFISGYQASTKALSKAYTVLFPPHCCLLNSEVLGPLAALPHSLVVSEVSGKLSLIIIILITQLYILVRGISIYNYNPNQRHSALYTFVCSVFVVQPVPMVKIMCGVAGKV